MRTGLLRDEALNLWEDEASAERPWGFRLDAVGRTYLVALERDLACGMKGDRPLRRWRGVSTLWSLAAVVQGLLTTGTWIQPAPPLRWMVARTLLLSARLLADRL
ncbi:hypothetical protein AA12717_3073 [Gluconacetobacter sacchari DSM 12717]|uniref:Uncharacterized protein n=1 Tax=Gluconacetobacter sacchari DSM 12717 TaxID=1307940 RepID=A0ABQ0PAA1_9PROT|nr:hypothetical protein AA12717_3073 [Gluconacetobacter sacchari DSM 12717]